MTGCKIEKSSGNVFEDIGLENAEELLKEAKKRFVLRMEEGTNCTEYIDKQDYPVKSDIDCWTKRVGRICNAYGDLRVVMFDGKFFWGIQNYDGIFFEEISKSLHDELIKLENKEREYYL